MQRCRLLIHQLVSNCIDCYFKTFLKSVFRAIISNMCGFFFGVQNPPKNSDCSHAGKKIGYCRIFSLSLQMSIGKGMNFHRAIAGTKRPSKIIPRPAISVGCHEDFLFVKDMIQSFTQIGRYQGIVVSTLFIIQVSNYLHGNVRIPPPCHPP